jgi:predicted transcriptional regulator
VHALVGKRVQFDDETWAAIEAVAGKSGRSFQEVADEAFADFLKKHKQPVGLKAALRESVGGKPTNARKPKT